MCQICDCFHQFLELFFSIPCSALSLPSIGPMLNPRILAIMGYRSTFSKDGTAIPARMSGPAAKKIAFMLGICSGSYPCPPRGGIFVPPLDFELRATMGKGPVGTTTGSPSRGFELKCRDAGTWARRYTLNVALAPSGDWYAISASASDFA